MLLSELSKIIDIKKIYKRKNNKEFNKISSSSININNKTLFIINSKKNIKKDYLKEAYNKKIPAIITNKIYKNINITQFLVKNIDKETKKILRILKPNPPLNTIAITGTNGKTSVAWYISQICRLNNINNKMQGTLGYYVNGKKINSSFLTTPEYETLYQNAYSHNKNKYIFIFEASSHSLHQDRLKNLKVNIAAITNLTQDHLDYHKTNNNYINAKLKLFSRYLNKFGFAIINYRLDNFKDILKILKKRNIKKIVYGKKNVFFENENNILFLHVNKIRYKLKNYNINEIEKQNLECAISCCLKLNLSIKKIIQSLYKIKNPPGRSEIVYFKKKSSKIIIDFAHTPDALKNILIVNTINNVKPSIVFGCGGNRDKNKRKLMGKIANKYAKNIFITDDNPRKEDPKAIRSEILKHCPNGIEVSNRLIAIKEAIKTISKNNILIIAGKGHEKKQILKDRTINFDDLKVVKELVNKH